MKKILFTICASALALSAAHASLSYLNDEHVAKIDEFKLPSFQPQNVIPSDEEITFKVVKMDDFQWIGANDKEFTGLKTTKVQDCIAVALVNENKIGLGHVSYDPQYHETFKSLISDTTDPFDVYLLSRYHSENLNVVLDIINSKNNLSVKGTHIERNYLEYATEGMFAGTPIAFCYGDRTIRPEANNWLSATVAVHRGDSTVSITYKTS